MYTVRTGPHEIVIANSATIRQSTDVWYKAAFEHFVLKEMQAHLQSRAFRYWRDKRGHEVDFVPADRRPAPLAIECKWSAPEFDPGHLKAFRKQHPKGENLVVAHDVDRSFTRTYGNLSVRFANVQDLIAKVKGQST